MPTEIELIPLEDQATRKRAIEKPKPIKLVIPKLRTDSKILAFTPRKERKAGVPVIPGDPCCAKICKVLNDDIDRKANILNTIASIGGTYENRLYRYILYGREILEDHRHNLKDKEICRCIEETGAVSIMVPLIRAIDAAKKGRLTGSVQHGGTIPYSSSKGIRGIHIKEKSTIPTGNACCPKSCELLNSEIDKNNTVLDHMELRGGQAVYDNPKYEALSYGTFHLQEHRNELKKRESCKCFE